MRKIVVPQLQLFVLTFSYIWAITLCSWIYISQLHLYLFYISQSICHDCDFTANNTDYSSNIYITQFWLFLVIATFYLTIALFFFLFLTWETFLHISFTRLKLLPVIVMLNVDLCICRNFVLNACVKCTCKADCRYTDKHSENSETTIIQSKLKCFAAIFWDFARPQIH